MYKDFPEYKATVKPRVIKSTKTKYLTIDGTGSPEDESYGEVISALYGAAYTIKMTRKNNIDPDYVVCKLECEWITLDFENTPPEKWEWKLQIRVPEFVKDEELEKAKEVILAKDGTQKVKDLYFEIVEPAKYVQMMHIGPYDKEGESYTLLAEFAKEQGLEVFGCARDIYISDPRRIPPERLKTVIRSRVK